MARLLTKNTLVLFTALSMFALTGTPALAQEKDGKEEIRELKERLEKLEKKMDESKSADGARKHGAVKGIYGVMINGGVTATAQGTNHLKNGPHRGSAMLSADLALAGPVGSDGEVTAVFDIQTGAGPKNLPPLFVSPNGNATGVNNDIESFNNDSVHLTQLYYEHDFNKRLIITLGKLDLTAYFDANRYANSERTQFLANSFVNNPAVEFGGSQDFNGPGMRATGRLSDSLDVTLGAFEGDGNFNDTFDSPFVMAEAGFKAAPNGKEGNYRFYLWTRQGRPNALSTANPTDERLGRSANNGLGFSFDQTLTETLGVWLRAGIQRQKIAQFDKYIGGGLHFSGLLPGRSADVAGLGYGASFTGTAYEDHMKTVAPRFKPGVEHYMEAYYSFAVAGSAANAGVHISPDIQLVINPGGDTDMTNLFVYGIRLQVFF